MALILGLSFILNLGPGTLLQLGSFRWGLVFSQMVFIAGPPLLALRWFYLDRRAVLPFRRPGPAGLLAAALGMTGLNHLLNLAGVLQEEVFPIPESYRAFFESQLAYRGPLDFTLLLVVFAVVPAFCEEILFRGFLLAGLRQTFESGPRAIVLASLIFAAFHYDPWRFTSVFALGLFLGLLTQRTASLVPAILAHALNNILSVSIAAVERSATAAPGTWWSAALAAGLVLLALRLLGRARPVPDPVL